MKARVKATGEIVEVIAISDYINEFGVVIGEYKDADGMPYTSYDLDFYIEEGITIPDYWTRLEHQYAGMAMQGVLSDNVAMEQIVYNQEGMIAKIVANFAVTCAHALVEKFRNEENPKELEGLKKEL